MKTEPKFQLRLDLGNGNKNSNNNNSSNNNVQDDEEDDSITSYTLQCDYANLKNIQVELQKAVDAYQGVHSQRISRYIA